MHPVLMFLAIIAFLGIPAGGVVGLHITQDDEDDGIAVGVSIAMLSVLVFAGIIFLNHWLVKNGWIEIGN